MLESYFPDDDLEFYRVGVKYIEELISFLEKTESLTDYDMDGDYDILFRMRNLFYCIKETLFQFPSIRSSIWYVQPLMLNNLAKQMSESDLIEYGIENLIGQYDKICKKLDLIQTRNRKF